MHSGLLKHRLRLDSTEKLEKRELVYENIQTLIQSSITEKYGKKVWCFHHAMYALLLVVCGEEVGCNSCLEFTPSSYTGGEFFGVSGFANKGMVAATLYWKGVTIFFGNFHLLHGEDTKHRFKGVQRLFLFNALLERCSIKADIAMFTGDFNFRVMKDFTKQTYHCQGKEGGVFVPSESGSPMEIVKMYGREDIDFQEILKTDDFLQKDWFVEELENVLEGKGSEVKEKEEFRDFIEETMGEYGFKEAVNAVRDILRVKKNLDLQEETIPFPPTYKFSEEGYSKKRRPAWTDRVFYKGKVDNTQATYTAEFNLPFSDHRPVILDKLKFSLPNTLAGVTAQLLQNKNKEHTSV